MSKRLNSLFTPDNVRLFDMLFRHQVYLEGFKQGVQKEYSDVLTNLYHSFFKYLLRNRYTSMDQFTKAELINFVRRFNNEQQRHYSIYTKKLVDLLRGFLAADVDIATQIFEISTGTTPADFNAKLNAKLSDNQFLAAHPAQQNFYVKSGNHYIIGEPDATQLFPTKDLSGTDAANARLWEQIISEPLPANGMYLKEYIVAFVSGAMAAVSNLIRQAYANNLSMQQTLQAIVGNVDNAFADGLFARLQAQNSTLVSTILQHVSTNAQSGIASVLYPRYMWISILDSHTTEVCRARNRVIYIYGKGPLPPAWYNCRSKTLPLGADQEPGFEIPKSYFKWISNQPESFQNDVLGKSLAASLRSGELGASNLNVFTTKPLTLEQFAQKIKFILGETQ